MILDKHKEVLAQTEQLATYYTNIDFPRLAENFSTAANSIRELISVLEKVEQVELVENAEEGKDAQQL